MDTQSCLDPKISNEESLDKVRKAFQAIKAQNLFRNESEIEKLPVTILLKLHKALEGHDGDKCPIRCMHLKQITKIKHGLRGFPYPIKTSAIDPKIFNSK